jgi:hypothetical protein
VIDREYQADAIDISAARCDIPSMQVGIRGEVHTLRAGERRTFVL